MSEVTPPSAELASSFDDDFTYRSYLKVPELLSLQQCVSTDEATGKPEHDETLFIIIHQVYELWFKQVLHEIEHIIVRLNEHKLSNARHHLHRVIKIFRTLIAQIDVLETMTPAEFASFRSFLANASGFQSAQFRELEFVLGTKDRVDLNWYDEQERARLQRRLDNPSLWDAFVRALAAGGLEVPAEVLDRDVRAPIEQNEALQDVIVSAYEGETFLGLCELLTDLDEKLQEWRYRHVMMVRRTIGTKPGTGGSDGASYLQTTLFKPVFPDLWAIRTKF